MKATESRKNKPRVLITGASGFIGSHLVDSALASGWEVVAAVRATSNLSHFRTETIQTFPFDLTRPSEILPNLKSYVATHGPFDYVIHNAGVTKIQYAGQFEEGNARFTETFARAVRDTHPDLTKFAFISSIAALGPGDPNTMKAIDELQTPNPITPYGASKLMGERSLSAVDGLPWVVIRPSAVYGPRDVKFLEWVTGMFRKGIDVRLGPADQRLSFVHVQDLTRFIIDSCASDISGESFNISDGNGYLQNALSDEVIRIIGAKTVKVRIPRDILIGIGRLIFTINSSRGKPVHLSHFKMKELTAKNWVIDISKSQQLLGYAPEYDLGSGLKQALANEKGPQ